MEKIYRIVKTVLFFIGGVLLLVFSHVFLENGFAFLPLLVGTVMVYYGIENILFVTLKKEIKKEQIKFLNGFITLLIGIIVLCQIGKAEDNIVIICVMWAVWAIVRESEEIYERTILTWDVKSVSILNAIESVIVIIFSVMLIVNPVKHHVYSHVILLGVELILEVSWGYLYDLIKKLRHND